MLMIYLLKEVILILRNIIMMEFTEQKKNKQTILRSFFSTNDSDDYLNITKFQG